MTPFKTEAGRSGHSAVPMRRTPSPAAATQAAEQQVPIRKTIGSQRAAAWMQDRLARSRRRRRAARPVRDQAQRYATSANAAATRKADRLDWACFAGWIASHGGRPAGPARDGRPLPDRHGPTPEGQHAGAAPRRHRHRPSSGGHGARHTPPAIRNVLRGIRRAQGVPGVRPRGNGGPGEAMASSAATTKPARAARSGTAAGGFAGAFRRAELMAL